MNVASKRIWITFSIPSLAEEILEEIAIRNKTDLLTLISDIVYQDTGIEIKPLDIRKKEDKHNQFLMYISLEVFKNEAIELTHKGIERNQSRQKLILDICANYIQTYLETLKEIKK